MIVLAFCFHEVFESELLKKYSPRLSGMLYATLILICMTKTLFLNGDWKSNYDVAWAWVRDYPSNSRGYALLGREYLSAGEFDKARAYLEKSILLGNQVPSDVFALGESYMLLGNFSKQKICSNKSSLDSLIILIPCFH